MERYLSREKLLEVRNHKHFNKGVAILIALLVADLLFLNFKVFAPAKYKTSTIFQDSVSPTQQSTNIVKGEDVCGESCMSEINKAISNAVSTTKTPAAPVVNSASGAQEYFIPLGSGSINSTTLTTITGMQATIDGGAYGSNYIATFEISVNVPTGNQTATFQLYNSTGNHPAWNSVVNFTSGGTPALLISSPITLDPGSNTYVVQGQTQLQFPANITQARVHIITN